MAVVETAVDAKAKAGAAMAWAATKAWAMATAVVVTAGAAKAGAAMRAGATGAASWGDLEACWAVGAMAAAVTATVAPLVESQAVWGVEVRVAG